MGRPLYVDKRTTETKVGVVLPAFVNMLRLTELLKDIDW